jgi:putative heme transporter
MAPPSPRAPSLSKAVWIVAANLLAIGAALMALQRTGTVVAWFLVALLLAIALEPAVRSLQRVGVPRGVGVLIVFVVAAGLLTGVVVTFVPIVAEQVQSLVESAPEWLERVRNTGWVQTAERRFHLVERMQDEIRARSPDLAGPVLGAVAGVLKGVVGIVTVTVLTIFMLLFGAEVFDRALEWLEPEQRGHYVELARRMRHTVGGYVAGTLLIAVIGGSVTAIGTLVLGVPYFLALGLLYTVLSIVPFVGSVIAGAVVALTTLASVGMGRALVALVAYLVYQQIENNLLHPVVQRRTIHMNPLVITVVILFGTALYGLLGALLALPFAGAVQVVLRDALARRKARYYSTAAAEPATEGPPPAAPSGRPPPRGPPP